jgi:hypothetical protein
MYTSCSGSKNDDGSHTAEEGSSSVNGSMYVGPIGFAAACGACNRVRNASNEAAESAGPSSGVWSTQAANAVFIAVV